MVKVKRTTKNEMTEGREILFKYFCCDVMHQVLFVDWLEDRIPDGNSCRVAVGETFVGSFSHETPFLVDRVEAAFSDFAVILIRALGPFHDFKNFKLKKLTKRCLKDN